jgi:hypothetical protein
MTKTISSGNSRSIPREKHAIIQPAFVAMITLLYFFTLPSNISRTKMQAKLSVDITITVISTLVEFSTIAEAIIAIILVKK